MTRKQTISILSLSLLSIMSGAAISPALSYIGDHFSDASELMIKMVISLPAIFIIPVTLLTGRLIFYIKKKTLVYMGLGFYLIGGVGGALVSSIIGLLVMRALMGIGTGLLIPLMRGIIADFYHGIERVKMMGYASAVNNLGGIVANLAGGILVIYSWRYPFLVYAVALIVLVLVILYMPNREVEAKRDQRVRITRNVWIIGLSHFMMILIFFAIPSGLSYYIAEMELGTGVTTGILISLVTVGSFLTGMNFHRIKTMLKGSTVMMGLFLMTIGMLGIAVFPTLLSLTISLSLIGVGIGILAPNIYLHTSLESTKQDITLALAIVSCFSFLGQFSSPILNKFLQDIFQFHTPASTFYISVGIGVIAMILVGVNKVVKAYIPNHTE